VSRLDDTFVGLRQRGETGLVTYVTAGDPDAERSTGILRAIDRAGADVLEVGVPFSDPVADGPVIERAAARARAAGGTLSATLELVARVRGDVRAPIVLFSYFNPLLAMGERRFAERAAEAGVDGVLALDLPVEEAGAFQGILSAEGLDTIFLLSPTTTESRIAKAASLGRGFLYAISRLGVTGARDTIAAGAGELVSRIRRHTTLPVALGFGLSRPEHVRQAGQCADAAVVGSALVAIVEEAAGGPDLEPRVEAFVRAMKEAGRPGRPSTGAEAAGPGGGRVAG
jgi:tryptophan synthase alpha chain